MDATARPRSTRDRPAKAPLSEGAIVDAALALVQAEGSQAVTMRRVAAALDTGAASLYVYFRNRDELLRAMLDRAAAGVPLVTPDPERWRDQVQDLLGAFLAALESYPGLAGVLPAEPPTTENTLAGAENLLGILLAGGIGPQDAAWACDILALIVTATAAEADVRRAAEKADDDTGDEALEDRMRSTFAALPPDRFPLLVGHAAELSVGESGERFRFAVDTFLDGLVARAARG